MSTINKLNVNSEDLRTTEGWDFIIDSGLVKLGEAEAKAAKLRVALEHFEKCRASGDPFPGEDKLRSMGLI